MPRTRHLIAALLLAFSCAASAVPGVHVVVDTHRLTLTVLSGGKVLAEFDNIAIGRGGAAEDRKREDQKTPLGDFRIARIKHDSIYHLFLGFDYPSRAQALRGLEKGWITRRQYDEITTALAHHDIPPQDTPLGGYIGIHGLGDGDPRIHARFNWTEGCIALTNDQIDRLASLVQLGTPVSVR